MRTTVILLVLAFLAGCTTSRKMATTTEQTATINTIADVRTEQVGHRKEQTASVTHTEITEAGDVEIVRKEYDTTQPVDSLTGTPPLKNETVIRRRAEKEIRQEQATESIATGTDSAVITDNTRQDIVTTVDTHSTEKHSRHPPWLFWLIAGVVLIVIYKTYKLIFR